MDDIVYRLEQSLPIPINLQDAIVTVGQANRERRAAAVKIRNLRALRIELEEQLADARNGAAGHRRTKIDNN